MELDDSQRLAAMQSLNELQWIGEEAASSERNIFKNDTSRTCFNPLIRLVPPTTN